LLDLEVEENPCKQKALIAVVFYNFCGGRHWDPNRIFHRSQNMYTNTPLKSDFFMLCGREKTC
jgi:hypothetical protein